MNDIDHDRRVFIERSLLMGASVAMTPVWARNPRGSEVSPNYLTDDSGANVLIDEGSVQPLLAL